MRSWIKKYKTLVLVVSGLCIYCILLAHSKKDTRPVDDSDFITFEYSGVELDLCPCCLGVWFDAGELPVVARRPDIASEEFSVVNLLLLPDENPGGKNHSCPVCRKAMLKKSVSHLTLYVCPCGAGVWVEGSDVPLVNERLFQQEDEDPVAIFAGVPRQW